MLEVVRVQSVTSCYCKKTKIPGGLKKAAVDPERTGAAAAGAATQEEKERLVKEEPFLQAYWKPGHEAAPPAASPASTIRPPTRTAA